MKNYFLLIAILINSLVISAQEKAEITKSGITKFQKTVKQSPRKDTTITIRLTQSKFDYFKQNKIELGAKASELLQNYSVPSADVAVKAKVDPNLIIAETTDASPKSSQIEIVRKRIIADGGFEITYSDSSKNILYKDRIIKINPEGYVMHALYSQVPEFVPPTAPNDPNLTIYLNNVSDKLMVILSGLLNNDAPSIANFKQGEANLSLYEIINRRFQFINYCIIQK